MTEQDASIIQDLKHNANKGMSDLLSVYGKRLFWMIRAKVPSDADAEDVLQNVLIKVLKGINSFKGESGLYTWMHRVAFNEAMNFLKKESKNMSHHSLELVSTATSLDNQDASEIVKILKQAIDTLPERQKQVFVMRYYEELKYEEISRILNLTEGSLKATYHIAAKKIEEYVTNR